MVKMILFERGDDSLWIEVDGPDRVRLGFGKGEGYADTKEATLTFSKARLIAYQILAEVEKASSIQA